MKKIKLVIFDMDGVLIDSERGMWIVNEQKVIEELGYEFSYEFARTLMGNSLAIAKKMMVEHYGKDFPSDKVYEKMFSLNQKMIDNKEIKLMKGAKELLDFIKANNIPTCIATSTESHLAKSILEGLDIRKYFDYVITGDMISNGKPAPDIYLKALGSYNKEDAIIFEDAHSGLRAGVAAGIDVFLVPDLAILTEDDYKDAYKVINNLGEAIDIIKEINNIK